MDSELIKNSGVNKSVRNSDNKDPNQKNICSSKQETVIGIATTVIPQNTKNSTYQIFNNLNVVSNISQTNQDINSTHNNHSIKTFHQNIRGQRTKQIKSFVTYFMIYHMYYVLLNTI
jgi:hypothetical protein